MTSNPLASIGRTFLITGTSRGIGLGLVKQILQSSSLDRVIATCRSPDGNTELQALKKTYSKDRFLLAPLEATSQQSHDELRRFLASENITAIDVLIANAGVAIDPAKDSFFSVTPSEVDYVWKSNGLGSLLTLQAYGDLVLQSPTKLAIVVSSIVGSIDLTKMNGAFGCVAYRSSKAAVNMLAATYSEDEKVKSAGGKILCLHPGWVQTDMGSSRAPLTIDQSVGGIVKVINTASQIQLNLPPNADPELAAFVQKFTTESNVFVDNDGQLLPW